MTPFIRVQPKPNPAAQTHPHPGVREAYRRQNESFARGTSEMWMNDLYVVILDRKVPEDPDNPTLVHLHIRRQDREAAHDWRDFQAIKNELVGPECEAIELYPAESRLVDTANSYHLWCFDDPNFRVGVGFTERRVEDEDALLGVSIGSKQRPRN